MPYRGLGSGIKRAIDAWPRIDFVDDPDGCLFTATVHRTPADKLNLTSDSPTMSVKNRETVGKASKKRRETVGKASVKRQKSVGKTARIVLDACQKNKDITIPEIAALAGVTERSIERNIQKLQADGLLRRVGGRKKGCLKILSGQY